MKKILSLTMAAVAALALSGCATTSAVKAPAGKPFTITADSGVAGYYTFDEEIKDNEVIDHSGNGLNVYTGALDGSISAPGKNGKGLSFNGTDEFITLDPSMIDGDGLTICAWVKANAWSTWARVFDIGNAKGNQDIFLCDDGRSANQLVFQIESGAAAHAPIPVPGDWTHIAATFGNGKIAMYINGKLAQELPTTTTMKDISADAQGIYIGRSNWSADPLFNGVMDDLLVAKRAFTAEEIASVYAGVVAPAAE